MKKKRRIRSLAAITLALSAFVFMLWSVSMFCITIATAQNFYDRLLKQSTEFAEYARTVGRFDSLYDDEYTYGYKKTVPSIVDYRMLDAIKSTNRMSLSHPGQDNGGADVLRGEPVELQTAVIFYDRGGNILHESGDFVYFQYVTGDVWDAGEEESRLSGFAYLDLGGGESGDDPYSLFRTIYSGTRSLYDIRALRITGFLKGAEIKPVKMDYVTETLIRQALDKTEPTEHYVGEDGTEYYHHEYTVSGLVRAGSLEWQTMFDHTDQAADKEELVTVYALYPQMNVYDKGEGVKYRGAEYENLHALLSAVGYKEYAEKGYPLTGICKYGLDEIIVFDARAFRDLTNYSFEPEEPMPDPDFVMVTAISSHPLRSAAGELRNVYIATLALAVLGVLLLRRMIGRNLIQPLEAISGGIADGWKRIAFPDDKRFKWREPFELYGHYERTQDRLRMDKNELARLGAALEYAKKAEQNRRQMTSNIAHELKTPLAVIHSYSEGLKEHIAEEKRDQYLDVILAESERMDAMVLEMLDLSRLEAGKVRLSRDDFSLTEMARSIFDKLRLAAEEKKLQISFDLRGDCVIAADEARIGQVVANFAANAVKYTPQGGSVLVKIYAERGDTRFSVENDSEPFTNEELSKVWETFYRADNARTGEGTGLGLAIAKSIIDLHGGTCFVRNTKTGVEFGFSISNR